MLGRTTKSEMGNGTLSFWGGGGSCVQDAYITCASLEVHQCLARQQEQKWLLEPFLLEQRRVGNMATSPLPSAPSAENENEIITSHPNLSIPGGGGANVGPAATLTPPTRGVPIAQHVIKLRHSYLIHGISRDRMWATGLHRP